VTTYVQTLNPALFFSAMTLTDESTGLPEIPETPDPEEPEPEEEPYSNGGGCNAGAGAAGIFAMALAAVTLRKISREAAKNEPRSTYSDRFSPFRFFTR
jgi:hypothetical protein